MENQTIKDSIDKLLIDELSENELVNIQNQITNNKELINYYNRTKKMKEELDKISENEPFKIDDLEIERRKLFNNIYSTERVFKLWHIAAAAILGAGLTGLATFAFNNPIKPIQMNSNLISFNIEQLDSKSFQITGKQISDFKIAGTINDPQIQTILLQTANQSNNLGSRINAIELLNKSKNNRITESFIGLALNDPNIALRLKAIEALNPYLSETKVQQTLIRLINDDENDMIRIAAFNQLNSLPITNETKPVYEDLIEKNPNEYIRQTALKRLINGEI